MSRYLLREWEDTHWYRGRLGNTHARWIAGSSGDNVGCCFGNFCRVSRDLIRRCWRISGRWNLELSHRITLDSRARWRLNTLSALQLNTRFWGKGSRQHFEIDNRQVCFNWLYSYGSCELLRYILQLLFYRIGGCSR
jgi:hypothetical protein